MKKILLQLCIIPACAYSQTVFRPSDYRVFDKRVYSFSEVIHIVDSINAMDPGWKLPSAKEMDSIFKATYNSRQIRSSITSWDCYTRDFQVNNVTGIVDTARVIGTMRGRELTLTYSDQDVNGHLKHYAFFLFKNPTAK